MPEAKKNGSYRDMTPAERLEFKRKLLEAWRQEAPEPPRKQLRYPTEGWFEEEG